MPSMLTESFGEIVSSPTWDVLLVLGLVVAGFIYGIMAGQRRIAAILMYTYIAYAITPAIPLDFLKDAARENEIYIRAALFLIILAVLAFSLGTKRKTIVPARSWWKVFLLALLQVGLFAHAILEFLPRAEQNNLAPITKNIFANPDYHLWWLVIPIAVIVILKRMEARDE